MSPTTRNVDIHSKLDGLKQDEEIIKHTLEQLMRSWKDLNFLDQQRFFILNQKLLQIKDERRALENRARTQRAHGSLRLPFRQRRQLQQQHQEHGILDECCKHLKAFFQCSI